MKIPNHLDPTIVTANGEVVHIGKKDNGLVIVDSMNKKPVVSFDEVSDEDTVDIFCNFAPGAAFGPINEDTSSNIVGSDGYQNTHDILINRDKHEKLIRVDVKNG